MKTLATLLVLVLVVGCSSSPSKKGDTTKKDDSGSAPMTKSEQLAAKKHELSQVDSQLADLAAERKTWEGRDPSEEKINRLQEIAQTESDLKSRRMQLKEEILVLEPEPADAGDALDAMEDAAKSQEDELDERIRKQAESEEARRLDEAARLKEEEMARMKKEADAMGGSGGGNKGDKTGPIFEERWADVIQRVKAELQRYKRW